MKHGNAIQDNVNYSNFLFKQIDKRMHASIGNYAAFQKVGVRQVACQLWDSVMHKFQLLCLPLKNKSYE